MNKLAPAATTTTEARAARIYELWDKYLREGDMEGMATIYTDDATLQSPLVNRTLL
jgi:hypothetical protein